MYRYKTKDGNDLIVVGFGTTVNGEITSENPIESANLVLVSGPEIAQTAGHIEGTVPQNVQSAPVQPVAPVNPTPESETTL